MENSSGSDIGFESKLWKTANKLRSNLDASQYKHVVLGLIFLKYMETSEAKQVNINPKIMEVLRKI